MRLRSISIVVILVFIWGMIFLLLNNNKNQIRDQYLNDRVNDLDIAFTETVSGYNRVAQLIFDEFINQPEILELYSGAYGASEARQSSIRDELFARLEDDYTRLQSLNLRQLHFHLPDNVSFLRFHRPERYGDDLTGVRFSVMAANDTLEPVTGFEEGRIFNGFRYVFPLFYEGEHIGSVETSVSFNAIQQEMNQLFPGGVTFLLNAEIVDAKVFEDEQSNYVISDFTESFAYDREVLDTYDNEAMPWETIQEINTMLPEDVAANMDIGKSFTAAVNLDNQDYIVSFLSVENVQNQHVAYIIAYRPDSFVGSIQLNFVMTMTAITISLVGFAIFLWQQDRNYSTIFQQRNDLSTKTAELTKANESLIIAKREAETANELKSQFLANMSHELRTPLNAIIGYTQLQISGMVGTLPERAQEFQERTLLNAKDLLRLINDLLDVSKIEAGRMELVITPFDLRNLLKEIDEQNRILAEEKGIGFTLNIDERLPQVIVGDQTRIKQILVNLISNAIKFTKEGGITLHVETASSEVWRIIVTDTGVGIPPHLHDVIFDEFRQASADDANDYGGTGLGLAITRRLIVMMGGSINVKSKVGEGSEFIVTLPLKIQINTPSPATKEII